MLHLNTIDKNIHSTLQSLFKKDYLKGFGLAGGTSLGLQLGHRKSIDIDLFAFEDIDMSEIAIQLENDFSDIIINKVSRVFIFCFINNVKSDIVNHSKNFLIQDLITEDGIRMFSCQDIAAMKLSAICGRGTRKDFYDLYILLKHFSLKEMLAWHNQKFNSDNSWMVLKSLQYFEDAEDTVEIHSLVPFPSWKEMKTFFTKAVNNFQIS